MENDVDWQFVTLGDQVRCDLGFHHQDTRLLYQLFCLCRSTHSYQKTFRALSHVAELRLSETTPPLRFCHCRNLWTLLGPKSAGIWSFSWAMRDKTLSPPSSWFCCVIFFRSFKLYHVLFYPLTAKFRHQNSGFGREGHGVSGAGLLRARVEGRFCCVHGASRQDHGPTPQVLFPRW